MQCAPNLTLHVCGSDCDGKLNLCLCREEKKKEILLCLTSSAVNGLWWRPAGQRSRFQR